MNNFTSLFWLVLLLPTSICLAQPSTDLELSIELTTPSPQIYDTYSIVYTLHNTGLETATDIEVNLPLPEGTTFQGGDEFTLTTGTFYPLPFANAINFWTISELPAGAVEQITLNYFLLNSNPVSHYGEIYNAAIGDPDSVPGNGTPPIVNEDDEAELTVPIIPPDLVITGSISDEAVVSGDNLNLSLSINNTGGSLAENAALLIVLSTDEQLSSDDLVLSMENLTGPFTASSSTYNFLLNIPTEVTTGNYFLLAGVDPTNAIEESNEANNIFLTTLVVEELLNPDCNMALEIRNINCDDNGTSENPLDDTFTYFVRATGRDLGAQFQLESEGMILGQFDYNIDIPFEGGLIEQADFTDFMATDLSNQSCTAMTELTPPQPCSEDFQPEGVDIELDLTSTNPQVGIFQSATFFLTVTNNGTEDAHGVEVDFPMALQTDIVFTDAVFPDFDLGNYEAFEDQIWRIDTLAVGQTGTMQLELFFLTKPFLYGELIALDEEDVDSTPNNGNGMTAREDDEVIFGDQIGLNCNIVVTVFNKICYDNGTPFDSTDDVFAFSFQARGENVSNTYQIIEPTGFDFQISYGATEQSIGVRPIADGPVTLTLQDRGNQSCQTTIEVEPTAPCSMGGDIIDVDKLIFDPDQFGRGDFSGLYPNVVQESFKLSVITNAPMTQVNIVNLQGQIILQEKWQTTTGLNQQEIDISNLPKGHYFVQITTGNLQEILRFVKV